MGKPNKTLSKEEMIVLNEKSALYRGQYIQMVSYIEMTIDYGIAYHYLGDRPQDFHEFMFVILTNTVGLHNKHEIFCSILQSRYPKLYKKYYNLPKTNKKTNPNTKSFKAKTAKIIETRNALAHWIAFPSWNEESKNHIEFTKITLKEQGLILTSVALNDAEMDKSITELRNVAEIIEEIVGEIIKIKTQATNPSAKS